MCSPLFKGDGPQLSTEFLVKNFNNYEIDLGFITINFNKTLFNILLPDFCFYLNIIFFNLR
jgi:hypothetical protein